MINNQEHPSKLYRLKNIYSILGSLLKEKKQERLKSAKFSSNILKNPSKRKIKVRKLNIVKENKSKNRNTERLKLNYLYHLDIVKRNNIRRIMIKENNSANVINSSMQNLKNSKIKDAKIQTDKNYLPIIIKKNLSKNYDNDSNRNNIGRAMIQYRIKKLHEQKRNKKYNNLKNNLKNYQTVKNINFPNIIHREHKERKIKDYLDIPNNLSTKVEIGNKRYNSILNNLRIKFHGNIFITRKTRDSDLNNYLKNKIRIKNLKNTYKVNSSISFDKSFNNSNKSKYEQICNFSNQMIKDSLSERHKKSIYKNIKILKNIYK